jgi:DNA-binding GntR family transcriptional regulator
MVVEHVNVSVSIELPLLGDDASVRRRSTMGRRVLDTIRQAIIQSQLRPGEPLSEAEIARQLGVSRQPVREAFIKLGEVGLLEIRPQRGTFVRLISIREVDNARFVREAIEVAIVRKAAGSTVADSIDPLADLIEEQKAFASRGDHIGFLRVDDAFHQGIARAADCDDAWRVLEGLKAQMDRVRFLSLPEATPLKRLIEQHESILDGIRSHSPGNAEEAVRRHLGEISVSLPKLAAKYPALFAD